MQQRPYLGLCFQGQISVHRCHISPTCSRIHKHTLTPLISKSGEGTNTVLTEAYEIRKYRECVCEPWSQVTCYASDLGQADYINNQVTPWRRSGYVHHYTRASCKEHAALYQKCWSRFYSISVCWCFSISVYPNLLVWSVCVFHGYQTHKVLWRQHIALPVELDFSHCKWDIALYSVCLFV